MSVRASLALVFGALLLGPAVAAERTGATPPQTRMTNDFPVATEVRLGGDDSQTRLVIDLSQKIDIRAFTLANPYRVVVDMPQVTFQFPPRTGDVGRGLIKAFRYGLVMQGGSRLVIDLTRPARIDKAFVLDAVNDQPARLVLDLAASDRETFMRFIALDNRVAGQGRPQSRAQRRRQGQRRSAAARGHRSRTRRHRQRHQGRERGAGEDHRPRILADGARQDREDRQVPRCHDPHRRHLRGARRPGRASRVRAKPRCSSRSTPTPWRVGRATPRGRPSTRFRSAHRTPRPRALPRPRTAQTRSPVSIFRPSRTMSPAS